MPRKRRKDRVENSLSQLAMIDDPRSADSTVLLEKALADKSSIIVARAASIIGRTGAPGFESALLEAFERFFENPVATDPSCLAKTALLEALDQLEYHDVEPFLRGARHVQLEPAWGRPEDTAPGLRARGAVGLARLDFEDTLLLFGELLADPAPPVRVAVVEALRHLGHRDGAALLLLRLRIGDDDPVVIFECMAALLALAPDYGVETLSDELDGANEERKEMAGIALGDSNREDALEALFGWADRAVVRHEREAAFKSIGLHRGRRARQFLLRMIASGPAPDARAAITALAAHKHDTTLFEAVKDAASLSELDLEEFVEHAFASS